jgi:hypothetical protein
MDDLRVVVVEQRDVYGYFNSYGAAEKWAMENVPKDKEFRLQPLTVIFPLTCPAEGHGGTGPCIGGCCTTCCPTCNAKQTVCGHRVVASRSGLYDHLCGKHKDHLIHCSPAAVGYHDFVEYAHV